MSDLVEFLLARIAEDEKAARSANGPRWAPGDGNVSEGGLYALEGDGSDGWAIAWFELGTANEAEDGSRQLPRWPKLELLAHANATHAARHDPARVLAECEAKRRIVTDRGFLDIHGILSIFGARILGYMAEPYRDHPDYDETWRP